MKEKIILEDCKYFVDSDGIIKEPNDVWHISYDFQYKKYIELMEDYDDYNPSSLTVECFYTIEQVKEYCKKFIDDNTHRLESDTYDTRKYVFELVKNYKKYGIKIPELEKYDTEQYKKEQIRTLENTIFKLKKSIEKLEMGK